MDIHWFGQSCFRLRSTQGTVVLDPFGKEAGLKPPHLKADIVTLSQGEEGRAHAAAIEGHSMVIDGPGEYEIKGIFIVGVPTQRGPDRDGNVGRNTVYCVALDDLTVCHLGNLGHQLTQAQIEELGTVDVLLVPVGGHGSLNAAQAAETVRLIDPAIAIPMRFQAPGRPDLDDVGKFLAEMGAGSAEAVDGLKLVSGRLPEELQVVVLQTRQ